MPQTTKTPVMVLQELAIKRGLPNPGYQLIYSISGRHENRFDFAVSIAGIEAVGTGASKQVGKHRAARNALMKLEQMGIYDPKEDPFADFKAPLMDENSTFKSVPGYIVELQHKCLEHKLPLPQYIEISDVGPPHAKEFAYECRVSKIVTEAKASTKKIAKQIAAKEMLERLNEIVPDEEGHVPATYSDIPKDTSKADNLIPNKMATFTDVIYTIKKIMDMKQITYADVADDLKVISEESLKKILDKLDVDYEIKELQDVPAIVELTLKIETVFTLLGIGADVQQAKESALNQSFTILQQYMQLP